MVLIKDLLIGSWKFRRGIRKEEVGGGSKSNAHKEEVSV